MTKDEYFFYEWLIISKGVTTEEYNELTEYQLNILYHEYQEFKKSLN